MMEEDLVMEAGHHSASFSSNSSTSSEDVQPQVHDQFIKLASALKETNDNMLTYESMLNQYRKLARIEPFLQNVDSKDVSRVVEPFPKPLQNDDIIEQLKMLTMAVSKLQSNEESGLKTSSDEHASSIDLYEARQQISKLKIRVEELELKLDEKSRFCEGLVESHRRVTCLLNEEKDRSNELDKKLDIEKKAAAKVGKDITKYVERMTELEQKVQSTSPKLAESEKRLAESEKRLAESAKDCQKHEQEIMNLKLQLTKEKEKNSDLQMSSDKSLLTIKRLENDVLSYLEKVSLLEARIRLDSEEKEFLKTRIESATVSRISEATNQSTIDTTFSSSGGFCQSCIDGSNMEEVARKVQKLAEENYAKIEADLVRYKAHNEFLSSRHSELESKLKEEETLRRSCSGKLRLCEEQIRLYEDQVKDWKFELESLQKELERCQLQQQSQPSDSDSARDRKEKRKLENELKDLRLRLAEALATKESMSDNVSRLTSSLEEANEKLAFSEETLQRLKSKSKILLRQYRAKRQSNEDLRVKIENIHQCLLELKNLCRTKDENYRDILDHLGSQAQISARLIAAYMDLPYSQEILTLDGNVKLTHWFSSIQIVSTWTHKQLMSFGSKCWSDIASQKSRQFFADPDTLSEISHTLEQDSEKEKSVLSLIDAQDRISRTQKDSFNLLISKAKSTFP